MYKDKKFGVFGLGISGLATIKYLQEKQADFISFDDKASLNESYFKDLSDPAWQKIDYLILSPGIPNSHPIVKIANQIKAKIICDIELLYLDNKESKFIGITGTNGKSTTTALISHILRYNGVNVLTGGNIGIPVLELKPKKDSVFVIEVSSFQLDLLDQTKFDIALLLNITPDHLDRHGSMENYRRAKYRIFAHQTDKDVAIINESLEHNANMIAFSADKLTYDLPQNNSLLGAHNKENIAASFACCLKFGLSPEQIISSLPSFIGLKHRMQYLGQRDQVTFINDSKATNADSTAKALSSFDNIIWIVGGVAKAGGIDSLVEYFPKIKQALLIGASQDDFSITCGQKLVWQKCDNLENAFHIACKLAKPGDVVLLSPACASYDQWKNFEERGEAFIELVSH